MNISNRRAMHNRSRQSLEKAEQAAIIQLLESLGAKVYVLGTTRRKGDYQGTMQTPGIGDLYAFIPASPTANVKALWVEAKAPRGRPSQAQREFQELCRRARVEHVMGGIDHVQNWLVDHGWLRESERRHVDAGRTLVGEQRT